MTALDAGPSAVETCPGCGVVLAVGDCGTHAYLGASPSCWALFGEVLAREYGDPAYMAVHRMTVDTYGAQHPGVPERRTIRSINVHPAGLYLTVEKALAGDFARRVIGTLVADCDQDFRWLAPPSDLGRVRICDVAQASDPRTHRDAVQAWGRSVWAAWSDHHAEVIAMAEAALRRL